MTTPTTAPNVVALRGAITDAPALDRRQAEELTRDIRRALEHGVELLVRAWRGRAWEVLGHATWEDYLAAEFGDLRELRLPTGPRRERVLEFRRAGMPVGAIQAVPGAGSRGTVAGDLKVLREDGRLDDELVTGHDGRTYRATRPAAPVIDEHTPAGKLTTVDRVALAVANAGTRGATTLDLMRALKWRQGPASAALSTAAKRGRVVHAGAFRDGFGVYTTPTPVLEA